MLAACVEQQQVPVAQALIVVAIVHDAGIGAAADDGVIGNIRIVRAKFMQQFRHDLVLHAPRTGKAHGAAMRAHRDLRGAPQARLLGTALVQAHVVEHMAQRDEFLRRARALSCVHPHPVHPAEHARIELEVRPHGVENPRPLLHETRQDLIDVRDGKRIVRAVALHRAVGAGPRAVP